MGGPVPVFLQNAPTLEDEYQATILHAFWELSTCRSIGMGIGPIPWTAVDAYAQRHGFEDDDYHDFVFLIQELDEEFLRLEAKKQDEATRKNG